MPNLAVRMLIGLALGFGFGMAGMFSAWFVYLFAVPRSSTVMLAMLMIGGGIGAGAASVVSWADLRHNRRRSVMIGVALGAAAGSAGAFGAYLYIASKGEVLVEVDRLAVVYRPDINPVLLMILGATLAANAAALLLLAGREVAGRKR